MSYFRVTPHALWVQREELDTAYRELCQDMAEVSRVIRRLEEMSSFGNPVEALRRTPRRAGDQEVKLRQCANILDTVADLYNRTELKNLDGQPPAARPGLNGVTYMITPIPICRTLEMLPDAGSYYGMNVVIPQDD